jgi:hypothetical protein
MLMVVGVAMPSHRTSAIPAVNDITVPRANGAQPLS